MASLGSSSPLADPCTARYILQSEHTPQHTLAIENVNTLPGLFSWQAHRRHEAPLFSFRPQANDKLIQLSYGETHSQASHVARHLTRHYPAVRSRAPVVGVWLEKSINLHLAILGTTLSGATWLPFDADAPASRVTVCLQDSKACVLICDVAHRDAAVQATLSIEGCELVVIEEIQSVVEQEDTATTLIGPQPDDTAYMIYTSGSTGTPKGIEIPHSAAVAFALSEQSVLGTGVNDIVWQGFSPAFDMFIEEVWVSIAGGAQLAIGSRSECQDVPSLGGSEGVWAERAVTIVNAVPTLINIMTSLDAECPLPSKVRVLNLGGEACPPDLVNRLSTPSLRILNTYGPSETTVTATFQELLPNQEVTIGKPLPLYHALLLPIEDPLPPNPTPILLQEGAEGELAIGGACLGKGYVNLPSLTQQKFINHPLLAGERLYRSGDRVRLDANLNIVFIGRIDTQVKHRGFRIELGEIENALAAHPKVQTVALILSTATNHLEAYIVGEHDEKISIAELRSELGRLPSYMQPEAYFFLPAEEIPRLPSGKINRNALQETSAKLADELDELTPRTSNSTMVPDDGSDISFLLKEMSKVFPRAEISSTTDFFDDLGGHSLVAAQLVSNVRKESPEGSPLKHLGLQSVYQQRTAEKILASLDCIRTGSRGTLEKKTSFNATVGDHWNVSRRNYVLCGLAQLPPLLFFCFIEAACILAPYLVFFVILEIFDLGTAIVLTYFTFVLIPPSRALVGIAGKWLTLGKAKAGEYPLYGFYYYRWWLAEEFVRLIDMVTIADTPLLPAMLRLLGADVGTYCHLRALNIGAAMDLISIGDDVCIGADVALASSWVERGRLVLAPITIASQAHVGSNTVLEGNSSIGEAGEIAALAMLPQGGHVPTGERFIGSPARYEGPATDIGGMRATRPGVARKAAMTTMMAFSSVFILPIIVFLPQIPSMLLFDYVDLKWAGWYLQTAIVAAPAGVIYMILVFIELIVLRWIVLGKVKERKFSTSSVYFYRKWLADRFMDISLVILLPVYATLYVVPFLRTLGVKIGRGAEVSTARGINFELTEIGDESFIADGVLVGDDVVRRNMVTLTKTKLEQRAFLGNQSLIAQGSVIASNTLVGVMSCAPSIPLKDGQSCFGSPPVLMPARQAAAVNHDSRVLYSPTKLMVMQRLTIEGMRIIIPRILITFGLGFSVQIVQTAWNELGRWPFVLLMPVFYILFFAFPALLITLIFKWTIIGRYTRAEWPLWSVDVWKSEFVTATYEALAGPFVSDLLMGTPYLAMVFRLFGVQVGAKTTLLSTDITEYDMVSIGDEAVINRHSGPQTHLFEDRVMKVGRVDIERRGCMKAYSICLPGSRIQENGQLGSLSLVMKGEAVPAGEAWEGAPIAPRRSSS